MAPSWAIIERNLDCIRQRIADAATRAGRAPDAVRLVAVTKSVGLDEVRALVDLGVRDLAENRPERSADRISAIGHGVRWHMIGTLQRRKAGDIATLFDAVDSIDRIEAAVSLDQKCREVGKTMPVLLEVNVSGEASKHGFAPVGLADALDELAPLSNLRIEGLMTMAPFCEHAEDARPVFAGLRELASRHGLRELSMGMSNDFEVAIEEGATQVRVGTALFE